MLYSHPLKQVFKNRTKRLVQHEHKGPIDLRALCFCFISVPLEEIIQYVPL